MPHAGLLHPTATIVPGSAIPETCRPGEGISSKVRRVASAKQPLPEQRTFEEHKAGLVDGHIIVNALRYPSIDVA